MAHRGSGGAVQPLHHVRHLIDAQHGQLILIGVPLQQSGDAEEHASALCVSTTPSAVANVPVRRRRLVSVLFVCNLRRLSDTRQIVKWRYHAN